MTDYLFRKFYKILAVLAVTSVLVAVVYFFFYWFVPSGYWVLVCLLAVVLVALGYGMQTFYGAVTSSRHNARADYYDESGYEAASKPFRPLRAALPILIAAILGLISRGLIDKWFYHLYISGDSHIYSENSLYPYMGALTVFGLIFAGIVLWFYPPHRIISMRSMMAYFGVLGVLFIAAVTMSVPTAFMSLSLIVFFTCSFIVLNQTHIRRGVTGTLTAISNDGKYYNLKLMIVASVVVVGILLVFAAVFTGVGFVLRFVFTYIAVKILNSNSDENQYYDEDQAASDFSDVMLENQPVGDRLLIVLCIVLFLGALVFFIFRGSSLIKRFVEAVKNWLRELFMFFMNARDYSSIGRSLSREFANYTDEAISLQDAAIRAYDPKAAERRSYREFVAYLNSLPTATDQIRYAYITMLSVFRSLGYGIRRSETPRETKLRVASRSSHDLDTVISALEAVDYIECEPPDEVCDKAVGEMCRIIRNNFTE